MANIKELKERIRSTKSTLKITSAMKLVSAAKLAKAQSRIMGFKPYSNEMEKTVKIASTLSEGYSNPFLREDEEGKNLIIVISSDKGLCGGYNSMLFKKVKTYLNDNADTEIITIGRKVRELLKRDNVSITKEFGFEKTEPSMEEARAIVDEIKKGFLDRQYNKVSIAFNTFISAIEFNSEIKQVLPLVVSGQERTDIEENYPVDFLYEPSASVVLDELIPEVINSAIFTCILDAQAAEHSSRMNAMDNATKNSKEMIRNLTLTMNKLRQAAITTELTEIVSGAESLNS